MNKAINVQVNISGLALTNKSVTDINIDRTFADTGCKFSITVIDSPEVLLTDLELFMCGTSNNRAVTIRYGDSTNSDDFELFVGTAWDYTNTFVGNIKSLTITGTASRRVSYSQSVGEACYNIDWNSYYNMRVDDTKPWNVIKQIDMHEYLRRSWESHVADYDEANVPVKQSDVALSTYRIFYDYNSVRVKVQGPGGTILLPVPDSFAVMSLGRTTYTAPAGGSVTYPSGDEYDLGDRFWGTLDWQHLYGKTRRAGGGAEWQWSTFRHAYDVNYTDNDGEEYWTYQVDYTKEPGFFYSTIDGVKHFRAFKLTENDNAYIQMNPASPYAGAGICLYNNQGVDISHIVRQLAILEGWKVGTIAQTELVPCSDTFKMEGKTALAFIQENLVPKAITPIGEYKKDGVLTPLTKGVAGFVASFDSEGYFNFVPLSSEITKDRTEINLGYNIPDSPVISFQVDTKGSLFYTEQATEINSLNIVTGENYTSIATSEEAQVASYNKTYSHNEHLDNFFGYTYEEINQIANRLSPEVRLQAYKDGLWVGFYADGESPKKQSYTITYRPKDLFPYAEYTVSNLPVYSSVAYQNRLVTKMTASAAIDKRSLDIIAQNAYDKIKGHMITATLTIWGNTKIRPSSIIKITNMVKTNNPFSPTEPHPTSGLYLVRKQTDTISNGQFIQKLSLTKQTSDLETELTKYENVDWSSLSYDTSYLKTNFTHDVLLTHTLVLQMK